MLSITFQVYSVVGSFYGNGELKDYLLTFTTLEQANNALISLAAQYDKNNGELIEHISKDGLFNSSVEYHGKDGTISKWRIQTNYLAFTNK